MPEGKLNLVDGGWTVAGDGYIEALGSSPTALRVTKGAVRRREGTRMGIAGILNRLFDVI